MAAAARMMKMIRGVKASKMAGAGLMGDLKVNFFSTVTPPPPPPIWKSESESAVVQNGSELKKEKEEEEEEVKMWEVDPVAEELAAARRKRKRGGPTRILDACNSETMKEYAIFGLDQINQTQHTNLQLMRILGAWQKIGPWIKYDITLEATDGGGKGKFYRVAVTDLYKKLELVQWALLDDPSPPIIPFKPGTNLEYLADRNARLESLRKPRPHFTYPDRNANGWV